MIVDVIIVVVELMFVVFIVVVVVGYYSVCFESPRDVEAMPISAVYLDYR